MTQLPILRITWADSLYAPDLQARISALLDEDDHLEAIITRRFDRIVKDGQFKTSFDLRGCQKLVSGSSGVEITDCRRPLLSCCSQEDHLYIRHITPGFCSDQTSLIMLHRDIVIVLPETSEDHRSTLKLEVEAQVFIAKPRSSHERLHLTELLKQIAQHASGLISYANKDGIVLRDASDILPEQSLTLVP